MSTTPTIPSPRPHAPGPALRWGILGPGSIAGRFADALARNGRQSVVAVGSRTLERATRFAGQRGIEAAVGSPRELVERTDIDVVYIATPHSSHREMAELALGAGKHVLIEKPLATTAEDAAAITDGARQHGLLAMEAMWTRYLPQADVLRQLLDDSVIGEVVQVEAAFGFIAPFDPGHRLYSPALAGGALLDAGVYPVSFVASVLGAPTSVHALGTLASTGVDDHALLTLPYPGAMATASTSLRVNLSVRAVISGTGGRIEIEPPYIVPSTLTLTTAGNWRPDPNAERWTDDTFDEPYDALYYEAEAAARYIGEGRVESPIHDHAETVAIIRALEDARRQIGAS